MKVAILSVTEGKGFGAEVVLLELLKAIPGGQDYITVIAPETTGVFLKSKELGYSVIPFPASRDSLKSNFMAAVKVRSLCKGFDIIHGWTARTFELLFILRSSRKQKISATLHDHPCANFHGSLRRKLMRFSGNRFDGMVSVSKAVSKECSQNGYRNKITTIHNGLTDDPVNLEGMTKSKETGITNLVFLGMYSPVKGFEILHNYLNSEELPQSLHWHLYGDVCDDYKGKADSLKGIGKNVFLHGRQPVNQIFTEADILVHASTSFDSLPTVLIEAARSGIPSIASAKGGASEIVIDGKTGFVFDPEKPDAFKKALEKCLQNPQLIQEMGKAARTQFEKDFKVGNMVESYLSFWRSLN